MSDHAPKMALVLSGGGARGAYAAGVLHYIRTKLSPEISYKRRFDILCGSSVGAINTCFLAATAHDLNYQGNQLYRLWRDLKQEDVYKRDVWNLIKLMMRSSWNISKNLFSRTSDEDVTMKTRHFKALLDTSPLVPLLKNSIPWNQITLNIQNRLISALSLTATNIGTGKLELFVEKHPDLPYTGDYIFHDIKLEYQHAMASAALPFLFPPILINGKHYMDGSLRSNTPMSPAVQLGADRILVVGLHYRGERPAQEPNNNDLSYSADVPTLGTILGKILNSMFLDKLDYDIEQMDRINRIIDWAESCYGHDFIDQINGYLKQAHITGDVASRGLKRLKALSIFPSRDLRGLFMESAQADQLFSKRLTSFERTLLKVLDVDLHSSKDFLSYIMFLPTYISKMLELGYEDAHNQRDEIEAFFYE